MIIIIVHEIHFIKNNDLFYKIDLSKPYKYLIQYRYIVRIDYRLTSELCFQPLFKKQWIIIQPSIPVDEISRAIGVVVTYLPSKHVPGVRFPDDAKKRERKGKERKREKQERKKKHFWNRPSVLKTQLVV